MAAAGDGDLAAGDAPGVDVTDLEMLGDPLQLPLVKPRAGVVGACCLVRGRGPAGARCNSADVTSPACQATLASCS